MVLVLILLTVWALIVSSKSLYARWLYVLASIVALILLGYYGLQDVQNHRIGH